MPNTAGLRVEGKTKRRLALGGKVEG